MWRYRRGILFVFLGLLLGLTFAHFETIIDFISEMDAKDWDIVFNIVGVIGVFLVAMQLRQMHDQAIATFEQTKREKTVEAIRAWNESYKIETRAATKFVEKLSDKQCRSLYENEPFEVEGEEIRALMCRICPDRANEGECPTDKEKCKLTSEAHCEIGKEKCKFRKKTYWVSGLRLATLRWHVIEYLNSVEATMTAWRLAILDDETIEEQFQTIFGMPTAEGNELKNFRDIAGGGKSYPNTELFHQHMVGKNEEESKRRQEEYKIKQKLPVMKKTKKKRP